MHAEFRWPLMATCLVSTLLGAGAPASGQNVSPNGLMAYSSWDDSGNYDIWRVNPSNPSLPPVKLTMDGSYNGNPDWSPDGRKIAYDGWGTGPGPRIRVMDTDPATDDSVVISDPCLPDVPCYGDFQPAWSPDGTRIAFVSSRPNADGTEAWGYQLYVMDVVGEVGALPQATRLTTDLPDPSTGKMIANSQVTWSPDGRRIAFLSTGRGANPDACDLWVMEPWDRDRDGFGDNLKRLTFDETLGACDAFENVTPQWSPASSLIAFTSTRSGYYDIWLVNADDPTDVRNVTQTPTGYEDQPGWSPDGARVTFRSDLSGTFEIYSLPVPPKSTTAASAVIPDSALFQTAAMPEATGAEFWTAAMAMSNPEVQLAAMTVGNPEYQVAAIQPAPPTRQQVTFDRRDKQHSDWGPRRTAPATWTMIVDNVGKGGLRSRPAGIACGVDCAATFVSGREVQLTAVPRPGSIFRGWGGACLGTTGPTCTVTMDRSKRIRAYFR